MALALLLLPPPLSGEPAPGGTAAKVRRASGSARPDAALYRAAQAAETSLRASRKRLAQRSEWEAVVLRYRKVVARYPRSGYSDNALLACGTLYREMAQRFRAARYREDALAAYRTLVAEYPSSSLGDDALFAAVELTRQAGSRPRLAEAARAYLETYPEGKRASEVKKLLRQREPASPLPKSPPPGLARIFDLRSWSGDASTRVVVDLERKVPIQYDRAYAPDRLWIDLAGTRLHPNLAKRAFPVGDGLLEQVRVGQNRDDVVRVVLDFKDVWEHQIFFLEDPARLVIDVRGRTRPQPQIASGPEAPQPPPAAPESADSAPGELRAPTRRIDGLVPPAASPAAAAPITIAGVDRPAAPPAPARSQPAADSPAQPLPTPQAPDANRTGKYSLARQLGLGARRIVIDAGHGGHDPGTIGRGGLQEKDLVLDVALRLERLVRQELGTEVTLTRSTDVFVPLEERTAIANSKGADLFVSIHANAARNPKARGIETYFLSFAKSAHAEAVAARENAISTATLKDLQNLVKAITLNTKIDESRELATSIQENVVKAVREKHAVPDRGVHTAPFYVLIGANMPAVLAELAFVSNPEDEKRLKSPAYRDVLARSLLGGLRSYLEALDRTNSRQLTDAARRPTVASGR